MENQFDLVVIGSGPGGYVAAIRAAQLGLRTACVEFEKALGGTCLRVGCIPSKALLEASHLYHEAKHDLGAFGIEVGSVGLNLGTMLKKKDDVVGQLTDGVAFLFKKNKVERFLGRGRITAPGKVTVELSAGGTQELSTKNIMIATGSTVARLPGVELDGDRIGTSTEALSYPAVPGHLVVIGAGVIGLELGSVWQRLGAKVTVVEYADRILPTMDRELGTLSKKILEKQGLEFRLGARVKGATVNGQGCKVEIEGSDPILCDRVLLAVGRIPYTEGLGLEAVGVAQGKRGDVLVDKHFQSNVPGIYAIGDVIRGAMLAHKAEEEGIACAEYIATGYGHVDYDSIPAVVYTHPEIASVGKTEEQLKEAQIKYKKGTFPFSANGRAKAIGSTEGRVKVLADAATDRVLGVHIVGAAAGDLIAEAAVAMAFGASSEDIARASHAHPSLAEAVKEAALAAGSGAIHI
ncbi:MAG TPA: dihydrolipoyl dehydrogenase [Polyangiaceae bacterium]|nr:dihydrolipoyl dehydrogenase [Polyangiaceae bacterium]